MSPAMRLLCPATGAAFTLAIVDYQFPTILNDDKWDANWLMVRGDVVLPGRAWTFLDPCLTTFELRFLAEWLERLARGDAISHEYFTEPNLAFVSVGDDLRVEFSHESQPPWIERPTDSFSVTFRLSPHDILKAAGEVRSLLRAFPERVPFRAKGSPAP